MCSSDLHRLPLAVYRTGLVMYQPPLFRGMYPTRQQVRQSQPLTAKQLELAEETYVRAYASRCEHEPPHGNRRECIKAIAESQRSKGMS